MAVVSTGFDPLFGDPLRKLIERAKAEGYDARIISGVRDDETSATVGRQRRGDRRWSTTALSRSRTCKEGRASRILSA